MPEPGAAPVPGDSSPRRRVLLIVAGGIAAYGNQRSAWDDGQRFDWENPEYRR